MNRFKNILVVYNDVPGADDALTQATTLAVANRARLTLIDGMPVGQRTPEMISEAEKRLRRTLRSLRSEGVEEAECVVLPEDGHDAVIRHVRENGHDMVIASSAAAASLPNALFGTLATALTRRCPCPVWIVKPGQSQAYRRILAAVDLAPGAANPDPLSAKIVEMAGSLAASHHAKLHILHSWDVTGRDADTLYSEIPDTTRERLIDAHGSARRAALESLLDRHNTGSANPILHLPRGVPEQTIREAASSLDIDVIIMGTQSRSSLFGLLFGNTTEFILSAARCGVLTVKPDDFEASAMAELVRDVA